MYIGLRSEKDRGFPDRLIHGNPSRVSAFPLNKRLRVVLVVLTFRFLAAFQVLRDKQVHFVQSVLVGKRNTVIVPVLSLLVLLSAQGSFLPSQSDGIKKMY